MSRILRDIAEWCPPALARAFGRPAALFFHGVEPQIADPDIQRNHHDAASFRAIARVLKTHFDVLPLAAMDDVLKAPERHPRALFLMSDDGYANTLTVAADILEEERLPWTLFISTHHIDTGEWNPMTLARLCGKSLEKQASADDARAALDAILAGFGQAELFEAMARFPSEDFLNWDGVRALHAQGVEIGAHAHWHWPMNVAQTPDYLREQAMVPHARIAAQLGSCRAFAYPFGNTEDISPEAWQAVRDAGYDYGFTTLSASLDGGANPWLLPRYGLGPREPNLAALVPLLRAGNGRLRQWQSRLAG